MQRWILVALGGMLGGCAPRPGPPPGVEAPVVATPSVPELSAESRATLAVFSTKLCTPRPGPGPDCAPWQGGPPCRDRALPERLAACSDAAACLEIAREIDGCGHCDVDLSTAVAERLAAVAGDCEGLLRFREQPLPFYVHDLDHAMCGDASIACLAASKHPRARAVLARWLADPRAAAVLRDDPSRTREWIELELQRARQGRSAAPDRWAVDYAMDLLGDDAWPLAPTLRQLATHPFVDRWDRRYWVLDSIERLGQWRDADSVETLRGLLGDARAVDQQMAAAIALGRIGPAAAAAVPVLDVLARGHWWPPLRALAAHAGRQIAGEPLEDLSPYDLPGTWDARCPLQHARVVGFDTPGGNDFWNAWPWAVSLDGSTISLGIHEPAKPTLPAEVASAALARFDHVDGSAVPVARGAKAVLPLQDGWVLGTNMGEFGGSLWWIDRDGTVEHLVATNVHAFVHLGGRPYALAGLDHMGTDGGALVSITEREHGVEVAHALTLTSEPLAWWPYRDGLMIGQLAGVLVVDADLDVTLAPCVAPPGTGGSLTDEQITATLQPVRAAVDRCMRPVANPEAPCEQARGLETGVWIDVDPTGRVLHVTRLDHEWGPLLPEVDRCVAEVLAPLRFPAPAGGSVRIGARWKATTESRSRRSPTRR